VAQITYFYTSLLFLNTPFGKEDGILIKSLYVVMRYPVLTCA